MRSDQPENDLLSEMAILLCCRPRVDFKIPSTILINWEQFKEAIDIEMSSNQLPRLAQVDCKGPETCCHDTMLCEKKVLICYHTP